MKHRNGVIWFSLLVLLTGYQQVVLAQQTTDTDSKQNTSAGHDWTYTSKHVPLDLKWRRHLEANLRWMIARQRLGPPKEAPRVAIYADAGTNYQLNGNLVRSLESAGIPCLLLDRSRIVNAELQDLEAFVIPGGYSTFQRNALGKRGISTLREFVQRGGKYLGICAGGYLASKDVHWEEKHYPYPLELFDGTAQGALDSIAPWPQEASVTLKLTKAGRQRGLDEKAEGTFYYKGGPHFHGGSNTTVLATYANGTAAIITRPYGNGEVILNGIHYERPAPRRLNNDDVPAVPEATAVVLQGLLEMASKTRGSIRRKVDPKIIRSVEVTDLAREDRINLEQNLRWILARTIKTSLPTKTPRVGVFADAGAEHASVLSIVALLESQGVAVEPLLYTDLHDQKIQQFETLIVPAGNHRILRDTLGERGQQAIDKFIKSGKQFLGISTGAYLAAKTIRWQQRTWEYPLKYFWGMAEGPVLELASWPAAAQVHLQPTAEGLARGLTKPLLVSCRYHGGPRFVNGRGGQVLAQYPDQSAAIVAKKIGRGEVILVGVEVMGPSTENHGAQFLLRLLKAD